MESEIIALATASEEAGWLKDQLSDSPLWEKPILAILIKVIAQQLLQRFKIGITVERDNKLS